MRTIANHKKQAIDNMKLLDDTLRLDPDDSETQDTDTALLAGSTFMHCLLYIGDGLHQVAEAIAVSRS